MQLPIDQRLVNVVCVCLRRKRWWDWLSDSLIRAPHAKLWIAATKLGVTSVHCPPLEAICSSKYIQHDAACTKFHFIPSPPTTIISQLNMICALEARCLVLRTKNGGLKNSSQEVEMKHDGHLSMLDYLTLKLTCSSKTPFLTLQVHCRICS